MKSQCKTCGNNCEGEYCFRHKPRKRIATSNLTKSVKKEDPVRKNIEMKNFFLQIWAKKPHKSEISGLSLGSEPLSTFFHHILPKNKYPEAGLDEENIILLTWEEHDQVERDIYHYEEVNTRRELLKKKYDI